MSTNAPSSERHHVVVIGSGFGGLFATQALKNADVDITLVAKTTQHLFQPLLYQVATGILSEGEIAPSTREVLNRQENATVVLSEVTRIDLEARTVTAKLLDRHHYLSYDSLIVAAGAGQSYFGNDHFAEFAPGMKSIDDALELRGRIFGSFELAEVADDPAERQTADDLRRRRRRPDRRRDGRPDRRAVPPHAAPRLPPDRHPRHPRHPARLRPDRPRRLRRPPRRQGGRQAARHRRRAPARHQGRQRRRDRHRGRGLRRHPPADRLGLQGVGRRCPGQPAGQDAGRPVRRGCRPRRPGQGQPGPDPARAPRGLRRRRHDGAGQAARRGPGRHPGRAVRGPGDRRRLAGEPARSRSSTTTRAAWRRSRGSARSPASASSA